MEKGILLSIRIISRGGSYGKSEQSTADCIGLEGCGLHNGRS